MKREINLVNISIGIRLDQEEMKNFSRRRNYVLDLLFEHTKRVELTFEKKEKYTEIDFRASLPESVVYGHHNFDSQLNKDWPNGAGAGWVLEINEDETKKASRRG